ncbi:UMP-CMP kinase 2, mitochondrial isoform X1 [Polypterus senegalus]|uniref:UMP-CMP kinase 2, mitochondrial isoform X1 n=2 Tax=Polypterus senegalus TaxID=55291 RepID=UPI0019627E74|nr:UMP-CMP kinase 2, mitochondrial isoform X1 [Polypterus senegalus]
MARNLARQLALWSARVFAAYSDRAEPLYFALSAERPVYQENAFLSLRRIFSNANVYSIHITTENRFLKETIHSKLQTQFSSLLQENCVLIQLVSFLPNQNRSVIPGFIVQDFQRNEETEITLKDMAKSNECLLCSYKKSEGADLWQQSIWCATEGAEVEGSTHYIIPSAKPAAHVSVLNVDSVVFHCFEDAYAALQECKECIPEAKEILHLADQSPRHMQRSNFPVIVIEGLDATGKTTLTKSLQETLKGTLLRSPPPQLSHWRDQFDSQPAVIRRAFYTLGNYITAAAIARESEKAPVIVDRYWPSTTAYAIATQVVGEKDNLPSLYSKVYQWPTDLLKPDLVVVLMVSPEERIRRLQERGQVKTQEEKELEENNLFREKVDEVYKRIEDSICKIIDANCPKEEVLQQVLHLISQYCRL